MRQSRVKANALDGFVPRNDAKRVKQKKQQKLCCFFVGVARLERATACTPCKNASQLHHTPIALAAAKIRMFFELMFTFRKKSYLCKV